MAEGRLAGLVAVVVGAGQTPGDTIVLCVDRLADRAEETVPSTLPTMRERRHSTPFDRRRIPV